MCTISFLLLPLRAPSNAARTRANMRLNNRGRRSRASDQRGELDERKSSLLSHVPKRTAKRTMQKVCNSNNIINDDNNNNAGNNNNNNNGNNDNDSN